MMHLAFATTAVLATWFCVAAMLIGIGFGLIALVRLAHPSHQPFLTAFWLGFATLLFLLQCWHFLFRISALPWVISSLIAVPGLWISRQIAAKSLVRMRQSRVWLVLAALAVLYAANRSIGPCLAFDSGLYGQPAVKWFVTYPLVIGLGNLNERIGFNNSILLFYAMLDHGFWQGRSQQLVNGLLLSVLLVQVTRGIARLFDRQSPRDCGDLFDAVLLIPAVVLAIDREFFNVASITTDTAVSIMMFVAASRLFRILANTTRDVSVDGFFVIVVLIAAITIKLSALAFAVAAGFLVWCTWFRLRRAEMFTFGSVTTLAVFAAALMVVAWMARGIILSGYLVYPATTGSMNVEWKVPDTVALKERTFIREFALHYYDVDSLGGAAIQEQNRTFSGSWLRPWISNAFALAKGEVVIPAALAILGLLLLVVTLTHAGDFPNVHKAAFLTYVPPLALLIQSVLLGPSPRFMFVGLWVFAAVGLSLGFRPFVLQSVIIRRAALAVICLLAVFLVAARARNYFVRHQPATALAVLFNVPGPDDGFYRLPDADLVPFVTQSGLTVLHTTKNGLIWDGPLLSSPERNPGLELRVAGNPRYGFRTALSRSEAVGQQQP
jgi:hypothetical protein